MRNDEVHPIPFSGFAPTLLTVSHLLAGCCGGAGSGGCSPQSAPHAASGGPPTQACIDQNLAIAARLYYQRLPELKRTHPRKFIAVTSAGNVYVGDSFLDVEEEAFKELPYSGVFIGSTIEVEPE